MYTESPPELPPLMDLTLPPLDLTVIGPENTAQSEVASSNQPEYSLPLYSSEHGTQNLNLMALPPASSGESTNEENPIAGDGPTGGETQNTPAQSGVEQPFSMPPLPAVTGTPGSLAQSLEEEAPAIPGEPIASDPVESGPNPLGDIFSPLPVQETPGPEAAPTTPEPSMPDFPSVECHACSSMNQVMTAERPTTITCASCGAQGYLAN